MSGAAWDDLGPRIGSAIVMALVGIGAVWAGGNVFLALVAILVGLMIWELARMLSPEQGAVATQLSVLAAAALILARVLPGGFVLPLVLAAAAVGAALLLRHKPLFALYGAAVLLAGYGFVALRDGAGLVWMLWLILVVIASDVAGYFAGRMLGGPKFWPRVSPKKTWSGTVAGWVGAALVGVGFWLMGPGGPGLVVLSIVTAFAAQMGDIAESAIKRKMGVKDSSALIPGHGGVLDRFDAMLGAALFVLAAGVAGFGPVALMAGAGG